MAKKKAVKKQKTKSKVKKKTVKRKTLSPQEQKMSIIAEYLEEVFHLSGHSVQEGTESSSPWHQIMSSMIFLHNQLESNVGHNIREITLVCECAEKEHKIQPQQIEHDCGGMH